MSFRSRSRTTQPLTSRHRSLSSSRAYSYNGTSYNGNASMGMRPLSTTGYSGTTSSYQSPYTSIYSSRESLSSGRTGSYYANGKTATTSSASTCAYLISCNNGSSNNYHHHHHHHHHHHQSQHYNQTAKCYIFPSNSSSATSSLANGYGGTGNNYSSDRYISPYSSSYDNGVTTASLSFSMGKSPASKMSSLSSAYGSNSYLNKGNGGESATVRLLKAKALSTSNSSLNTASTYGGGSGSNSAALAAIVSRSNSLREQERKSRNRTRSRSAAQRSLSASSEKSEGYEVGGSIKIVK